MRTGAACATVRDPIQRTGSARRARAKRRAARAGQQRLHRDLAGSG